MNEYLEEEIDGRDCYTKKSKYRASDIMDWNLEMKPISHRDRSIRDVEGQIANFIVFNNNYMFAKISNLESQFLKLSQKWKNETIMYSIDKQTINDTFLYLISMGKSIVPFILKDLQDPDNTARWHIALKTLTNENPILPSELSDSELVSKKWIQWGMDNKLI